MALLPPPDIGAEYVDEARRPSKDFYNWIRSLYVSVRSLSVTNLQNAANDAAAAAAGVPVGGIYRNGSVLMVRVV